MARCVSTAASAGITDAQLQLAALYQSGVGVPRSPGSAAYWLEKAANGANIEAMVRLAKLHLVGCAPSHAIFGQIGTPNYHLARTWAEQAAALGSPEGKAVLALVLERDGTGSQTEITRLLEEGVLAQDPSASLQLAVKLMSTRGHEIDRMRIASLVKVAAEYGLPQALYLYGVMKNVGFGCVQDNDHASVLYEKSSALGSSYGMGRHGAAMIANARNKKDFATGETWLRRSAFAGNGAAASMIGALRAGQDGLPPNFHEAIGWFQKAGDLNDPFGAKAEGLLAYLGYGGGSKVDAVLALLSKSRWLASRPALDPASLIVPGGLPFAFAIRATQWFELQAQSDDTRAILGLAACQAFGLEGEPDHAGALRFLEMRLGSARSRGHPEAFARRVPDAQNASAVFA